MSPSYSSALLVFVNKYNDIIISGTNTNSEVLFHSRGSALLVVDYYEELPSEIIVLIKWHPCVQL